MTRTEWEDAEKNISNGMECILRTIDKFLIMLSIAINGKGARRQTTCTMQRSVIELGILFKALQNTIQLQ